MSADPAASALDEIREREQAATPGPWEVHTSATIGINLASDETDWPLAQAWMRLEDAQFAAVARISIPRLLAAVDAALGRHVQAVIEDMPEPRFRYCDTCSGHPAWPCPEVAAITAALAGTQLSEDENHDRPS
jgi:hypothetical protein